MAYLFTWLKQASIKHVTEIGSWCQFISSLIPDRSNDALIEPPFFGKKTICCHALRLMY